MWTLECEGDALSGKTLWLRPGKKYVLGRTSGDGNEANARSRSRVTIKDLDTKIGTLLNGEQIRGKTEQLDREDNIVVLGRHKHHFRFKWVPLALTFSFTGKEKKADPWTALYEQLGPLDIKVLQEYEHGYTTHVVASKRNTPKGLQALIDGKYIVDTTYVKAIVDAAKSIEDDFANFPDALKFLPPKGKEPTERPATAYAPDPLRQDMFEGYLFVFYSQQQFDTLLPPITGGRGKALYREVIPDRTTVPEFVEYVKQVAGEKGLGELEDGSEGKGVVVVKFNPSAGQGIDWYANFNTEVALSLGYRLIEQNEFLDAILGGDSSVLRRPLEVASSSRTTAQPVSPVVDRSMAAPVSAPSEPAPRPAGRRGRRTVAKFQGFDDDFSLPVNLNSIPEVQPTPVAPAPVEESQSLFVTQQESDANVWREPSEEPPPIVQPRTRKRQATPMDDGERIDNLAPSLVKMKRIRLEEAAARRERGESTPVPPKAAKPAPPKEPTPPPPVKKSIKKTSKKMGDVEVEEAMRERMEEQEQAAAAERDAQLAIMADVDIADVQKGIEILEMSVGRTRAITRPSARADESERWDDNWNGRRNFKKFRRRGAPPTRGPERVIISLEEVKSKEFGIGDEYWVESASVDRESQRRTQKGKGRAAPEEESSDSDTPMRNSRRSKQRPAPISRNRTRDVTPAVVIQSSEDEIVDDEEEFPGDAALLPPPSKSRRQARITSQGSATSTTLTLEEPTSSSRKRSAEPLAKPAPNKKVRQATIGDMMGRRARAPVEEDSDDDDMRFGFRRR
ncbi:hypothetical protein HYFRA_00012257 [Hymenoscyphus fraxineus]|uniref:Nibrin second BRCT domain-containing protein n=1 Tax=Hymenoscyphus fraxineus TaxID=746836 RepID=A0A9N9L1Z1_9HELO|nr:hypothetical protein HYFRA_00012257 [Hymenoscyphus fraxineus]